LIYDVASGNNHIFNFNTQGGYELDCDNPRDDDERYICDTLKAEEECMTDACITERTGDVNPADPDEHTQAYTEEEYAE
jgi:hypothetical protein